MSTLAPTKNQHRIGDTHLRDYVVGEEREHESQRRKGLAVYKSLKTNALPMQRDDGSVGGGTGNQLRREVWMWLRTHEHQLLRFTTICEELSSTHTCT